MKRFLAERARGCICPPDLPVCVCGREPEAELITGRAVVPTAGEVADNPRAKSGRLRVGAQAPHGGGRLMARARGSGGTAEGRAPRSRTGTRSRARRPPLRGATPLARRMSGPAAAPAVAMPRRA